jgi:hypothetical protein
MIVSSTTLEDDEGKIDLMPEIRDWTHEKFERTGEPG